jgi:hypothetical protein
VGERFGKPARRVTGGEDTGSWENLQLFRHMISRRKRHFREIEPKMALGLGKMGLQQFRRSGIVVLRGGDGICGCSATSGIRRGDHEFGASYRQVA